MASSWPKLLSIREIFDCFVTTSEASLLVLSLLMIVVQGMALKIPLVDKKYLDLYRLHKVRCSQTITDILTHDESL